MSTTNQNKDKQLGKHTINKIFEKKISKKDTNMSELKNLIDYIRIADNVIIHFLDLLARNLKDYKKLAMKSQIKGHQSILSRKA